MVVLLVACACPAKPTTQVPATGSGSGSASSVAPVTATTCDQVKPRVEAMYRGEAQQKEPARVDEAVADNTTMVMNDCAKDPGKLVPCLATVGTIAQLEKTCLIPLDEEGTEGERR